MLVEDVQTMEHSHFFDFDILESDEWLDGPDLPDSLQAAASDQYEYCVERTKPTLSRPNEPVLMLRVHTRMYMSGCRNCTLYARDCCKYCRFHSNYREPGIGLLQQIVTLLYAIRLDDSGLAHSKYM